MTVFGATYASAYDQLYAEKHYDKECDMIQALMQLAPSAQPIRRLLDLGCGTGNHAIPLAQRGYVVTGVDLSEDMLLRAQSKASAVGVQDNTQFYQGDVRTIQLPNKGFDAGIMMFAVLGYQRTDDDVRAALKTARDHLALGAAFIFDVWYGPGVMTEKPGQRERIIRSGHEDVVRRTHSILDESRHLCTVHFDLEIIEHGITAKKVKEEHVMRFFFPDEIQKFAHECRFSVLTLRNFADWQQAVTADCWNVIAVLQAV